MVVTTFGPVQKRRSSDSGTRFRLAAHVHRQALCGVTSLVSHVLMTSSILWQQGWLSKVSGFWVLGSRFSQLHESLDASKLRRPQIESSGPQRRTCSVTLYNNPNCNLFPHHALDKPVRRVQFTCHVSVLALRYHFQGHCSPSQFLHSSKTLLEKR